MVAAAARLRAAELYMHSVFVLLSFFLQDDVEICFIDDSCKNPVGKFWNGSTLYVLQQAVSVPLSVRLVNVICFLAVQ